MGLRPAQPVDRIPIRWPPTQRHVVVSVAALWLAAALALIVYGLADGELVCDDAYYYFEIARNAALGRGFTFDELTSTNGFHPLWAWLLVPVFRLLPGSAWAPIHVALGLSALCTALVALCAFGLFDRRGRPTAGLFAALIWLFNPYTWVLTGRGTEGPLNVLCIALALLQLDAIRRRAEFTRRDAVGLGALVGLCILARTDNVLLLAAFSVVLLADLARASRLRLATRRAGWFLLATSGVVAPWIAWNLVTFGTVLQTSLVAKQMFDLYGRLPPLDAASTLGGASPVGIVVGAFRNLWLVAIYNAKYIVGEEWSAPRQGWIALYVTTGLALALALVPLLPRFRRSGSGGPSLWPVGVFCLFHFAWYALVGRNYYNWYFLPPVVAFCLFCGERFGRVWAGGTRPTRAAALVVVAAMAFTAPWMTSRHVRGDQRRLDEKIFSRDFAPKLAAVPPGTRTGLWNAGLAAYFASFRFPDRFVINLDGVVNNEVPRRARKSRYEEYILENIDYVLEYPTQMIQIVGSVRASRFSGRYIARNGRILRPPDEDRPPQ